MFLEARVGVVACSTWCENSQNLNMSGLCDPTFYQDSNFFVKSGLIMWRGVGRGSVSSFCSLHQIPKMSITPGKLTSIKYSGGHYVNIFMSVLLGQELL